ncbi:MAG: hypothetical protein WAX04_04155 [Oscillospiraceae bacterium]
MGSFVFSLMQIINFLLILGAIVGIAVVLVLTIKLLIKKNKLADIELQEHQKES